MPPRRRGYLITAHPDDTALRQAISDLSRADQPTPHQGTAPLLEVLANDRRTIIGYTVADYLLQHAFRQRRTTAVPEATWQALTSRRHAPADLARLAHSAANRMPAVTGRSCSRLRLVDSQPPDWGRSTGQLVMTQVDVYEYVTLPG